MSHVERNGHNDMHIFSIPFHSNFTLSLLWVLKLYRYEVILLL